MNIKGQISGNQFLVSLLTGLVVGLGAALEHFVRNPQLFRDSLSPLAAAMATTLAVGIYNWYQGRTVNEIVDDIIGKKNDET